MTEEEKKTFINSNAVLITIYKEMRQLSIEFSTRVSKTAVQKHIEDNFTWITSKQEKSEITGRPKKIFCSSVPYQANSVKIKLKNLTDYFNKSSIEVWYRFGENSPILKNWAEYIQAKCQCMPTPKDLDYKLELNQFGNVDATYRIPDGWHKTTLTVTQIKKQNLPYYKACIGFRDSYGNHMKPELINIILDDFSKQEQQYIDSIKAKKEKENKKIMDIPLTKELIAECLYSINKEAKRYRDMQADCVNKAYYSISEKYPGVHYQLHRAKDQKQSLYDLKDKVLQKAIAIWNLTPEGFHKFPDRNRDMYSFGGYSFHVNSNTSTNCLGNIEDMIEAERKRSIPPKKAVSLLKRFLTERM